MLQHDLPGNGKPQPAGALPLGTRGAVVPQKHLVLLIQRDAGAGVPHLQAGLVSLGVQPHRHHAARRGVVQRVGHQILQRLLQPQIVPPGDAAVPDLQGQPHILPDGSFPQPVGYPFGQRGQRHPVLVKDHLFFLQLGHQEHVLHQLAHEIQPVPHHPGQVPAGPGTGFQPVQTALHHKQRGAQIVKGVGHKGHPLHLLLPQGPGALLHLLLQSPVHRFQLGGKLFRPGELLGKLAADDPHPAEQKRQVEQLGILHGAQRKTHRLPGQAVQGNHHPQPLAQRLSGQGQPGAGPPGGAGPHQHKQAAQKQPRVGQIPHSRRDRGAQRAPEGQHSQCQRPAGHPAARPRQRQAEHPETQKQVQQRAPSVGVAGEKGRRGLPVAQRAKAPYREHRRVGRKPGQIGLAALVPVKGQGVQPISAVTPSPRPNRVL